YLPGVNSSIPRIREESNRQAINHPVQGSAAEIIKLAMRNIWNEALPTYWDAGYDIEPILQIHDELIYECQSDIAEEWAGVVTSYMETAMELCVPIVAEAHITKPGEEGGNWADLK